MCIRDRVGLMTKKYLEPAVYNKSNNELLQEAERLRRQKAVSYTHLDVYKRQVYKEATELCAYLCKEYKLDPMADGVIIGHYEGHKRGIASNHADPGHWFPKHGKSMDTFRAEVKKLLSAIEAPTSTELKKLYRVQVGAYSVKANADAMLKKVKAAGFKDAFIKYS